MIWLILAALLALTFIFVVAPLMRDPERGSDTIDAARRQLAQVESDLEAGRISPQVAAETRKALERRVLDILDAKAGKGTDTGFVRMLRLLVPLSLVLGTVGLYTMIGAPDFKPQPVVQQAAPSVSPDRQAAQDLVEQVQAKIRSGAETPTSIYMFLARALMSLERYDEALEAYQVAATRPDTTPAWRDEYERAKAYVTSAGARPPALDEQVIQNAQEMTPAERAQMIEGMVSGLAARLAENPRDLEGWTRLIRARVVMGDLSQAQTDFASAREAFQDEEISLDRLDTLGAELGLTVPE